MRKHTVYYTIEIQGQRTVDADTRAAAREEVHDDLDLDLVDIEADLLWIKTHAATGITGPTSIASLI